ncbi:MAG: type II toxin-antitoxin system VapC family toxin [Gemmatimonadota bacterium]
MGSASGLRFLLDTHIWIWSLEASDRLTDQVREELRAPSNEVWLSPVSAWEAMVLVQKGRLIVEPPPQDWVRRALERVPHREAPLNHEVALRSRTVSLPHNDPADRFLAASAQVYDLTLVTADDRLLHSADFAVLANR